MKGVQCYELFGGIAPNNHTFSLSLIYALLLRYLENVSYPKFLPTSTHTIFTILVNQHIVLVTALKQLFRKLLMICSFLLTKATYLYQPCFTFLQHLTQLIILSLYTVSILTLDLPILSFNGFHLSYLIVHTCLFIKSLFCFSPCTLWCSSWFSSWPYTFHYVFVCHYRLTLYHTPFIC